MKNSIKKEKNLVRQWFYSLSLSSSHSISISTFFLHLLLPLVTPRSDLTTSGEDSSLLNNMNSQRIFFIIPFLGNILRILFDLGQFFFDRNVSSIRQLVFSFYFSTSSTSTILYHTLPFSHHLQYLFSLPLSPSLSQSIPRSLSPINFSFSTPKSNQMKSNQIDDRVTIDNESQILMKINMITHAMYIRSAKKIVMSSSY